MMVTFISECEKKALDKTRRVLDAFADRLGTRTWQTVITDEGLQAVKKLLRATASKNTAVACHWLRSRSRSELVWIVGDRSKFNKQGLVPVNFTEQEIKQYMDKNQWQTLDIILYAVAISALFHDFGKAMELFQLKIDPDKSTLGYEPYRHEWISLRLFQAFVNNRSDEEWLNALCLVERDQDVFCFKDGLDGAVSSDNHPIQKLSPFARLVGWLILTHHKLPVYPNWKDGEHSQPMFQNISAWLSDNFNAVWNSHNCNDPDNQNRVEQNWKCNKQGLPYKSNLWRSKVCLLASEAKAKLNLKRHTINDFLNDQLFTVHISRLCLMLADHYYSAQSKVSTEWRSPDYNVWANTFKHRLHQQLDEHLIGVAHHGEKIVKALVKLNSSLGGLGNNDALSKKVEKKYKERFGWQDEAIQCTECLAQSTVEKGFFGINMASTGMGKTLANAKIMYALGSGTGRRRFNVALGLRTLTLQTGREYRSKCELNDEELAVVIGSAAVKELFNNEQSKQHSSEETGSESGEILLDPDLTVDYKGSVSKHSLSEWTGQEKGLEQLINAPVLVCTIDHLIPATEGTKGGKQIAPMLRLFTSDLVLDEPDDFGLEDLPALCRLVHWAGLLGSRVLLSTATMPPSLTYALFLAYQNGWKEYAKANVPEWNGEICCAWFDEFESNGGAYSKFDQFEVSNESFVNKRVKKLNTSVEAKRKGTIVTLDQTESESIACCMAKNIQKYIVELHQDHHQGHNNKKVSIGIVRMANIDPLVAVSRELLSLYVPENDIAIHYCVYHSKYPLGIRSYLECKLDRILKRKDPEDIWQQPEIMEKIKNSSQINHIFVVIASPVAEVGRDHDYDWAIIEPSSMRSIIQLAGRVLRHRSIIPSKPNIVLMNKNFKAIAGREICFAKPGFEIAELV
jgi:CRISPR-associated endonuclease/helicase Cas3